MGPALTASGGVVRARVNRAFACQIILLREGEDVWNGFQSTETTSQVAVPRERAVAQNLLGPMGIIGLGEN